MQLLPAHLLSHVFIVAVNKRDFETAFAIPVDRFFYFITAAHLFRDISDKDQKAIYTVKDSDWLKIDSTIFIPDNTFDLAVIKTDIPVNHDEENIILSSKNVALGQDLYFHLLSRICG